MAAVRNDPAHLGIKRFSLYKATTGHRYFRNIFFFQILVLDISKRKNYEEEKREREERERGRRGKKRIIVARAAMTMIRTIRIRSHVSVGVASGRPRLDVRW